MTKTELYLALRKKVEKNKVKREDKVRSIVSHLVDMEEYGIKVYKLNEYQYRFIKDLHRVDYFPTSGKYHDITLQVRGEIPAYKIITLFK